MFSLFKTQLMAPVAVMEHVGMIDIRFAGYAYMKELVNVSGLIFFSFLFFFKYSKRRS